MGDRAFSVMAPKLKNEFSPEYQTYSLPSALNIIFKPVCSSYSSLNNKKD